MKQIRSPQSWTTLRKTILARDHYQCRKCARAEGLHVHHIKPRVDHGTHDSDNLITLCVMCHREWESLQAGTSFPFKWWLKAPTLPQLLSLYGAAKKDTANADAVTLKQAVDELDKIVDWHRSAEWTGKHVGAMKRWIETTYPDEFQTAALE